MIVREAVITKDSETKGVEVMETHLPRKELSRFFSWVASKIKSTRLRLMMVLFNKGLSGKMSSAHPSAKPAQN